MIVAGISIVFVLCCLAVAVQRPAGAGRSLLAVAVGVLFGVVAVLTKIVMHPADGRRARLLATPLLYVLIVVAVIATLLQQSAFHAGSLRASVPAMLVLEPVVAVFLGEVVLSASTSRSQAHSGADHRSSER